MTGWGGLLTHSPAQIAQRALIALGLGGDREAGAGANSDWPCGIDVEPDSPDQVITVKDTQGVDGDRGMIDGLTHRQWGVQLMVRSRHSNVGSLKARTIANAMESLTCGMDVTVTNPGPTSTYRLHAFVGVGQPLPLGNEEGSSRFLHSLNARVVVRQLS